MIPHLHWHCSVQGINFHNFYTHAAIQLATRQVTDTRQTGRPVRGTAEIERQEEEGEVRFRVAAQGLSEVLSNC